MIRKAVSITVSCERNAPSRSCGQTKFIKGNPRRYPSQLAANAMRRADRVDRPTSAKGNKTPKHRHKLRLPSQLATNAMRRADRVARPATNSEGDVHHSKLRTQCAEHIVCGKTYLPKREYNDKAQKQTAAAITVSCERNAPSRSRGQARNKFRS